MRLLRNICFFLLLFFNNCVHAQVKFSIATDLSLLHNFEPTQKFTVLGQTLIPQWHIDKKTTLYAWISYHTNGKFENEMTATAKVPSTVPPTITFTNQSEMRLRQISIGIKQYLIGTYDKLEKFNLYAAGGFGLIHGRVINNFSATIDTSLYTVENNVRNGQGDFKRLTFDVTGGAEFPVSYEMYIYTEVRVHIPTSDYPCKYLLKNSHAPFLGGINVGIRVLIDSRP